MYHSNQQEEPTSPRLMACTHQTCKSNCHEYGIFFVPSVCRRYCGSRMEGCSCITKVLAEDVSSDGKVQMFQPTVSRGWKDAQNTQMNKKKHGTSDIGHIKCDDHIKRVSYSLYLDEKKPWGGKKTRLCTGWEFDSLTGNYDSRWRG